jgi:hypothetical protein
MAKMLNWNVQRTISEISKAGMPVLKECADIFRDEAKANLRPILVLNWKPHGPPPGGDIWKGREDYAEMLNTIRVVEKRDSKARNIRIYAGNYKTWWAVQMEWGRGGWKGGPRPFFRKSIQTSAPKIRALLAARRIK